MNLSLNIHPIQNHTVYTPLADRILSIYSLLLILIGTPCNILCSIIYLQKTNRMNSIKVIFGYLALLDTIVLYTFNLNYVFREFNVDVKKTTFNYNNKKDNVYVDQDGNTHGFIIKKNIEEYSLVICRLLSYLGEK